MHVNYLISNNGLKSEISGNKEMTPNVKEHAYLIKTRDDKRSCDRDDGPLMVYWYISDIVLLERDVSL